MSRPCKYPWFTWFNEDKHRIARWWFNDLSETSIRKIICIQAKRMGVRAAVTINERWVWVQASVVKAVEAQQISAGVQS